MRTTAIGGITVCLAVALVPLLAQRVLAAPSGPTSTTTASATTSSSTPSTATTTTIAATVPSVVARPTPTVTTTRPVAVRAPIDPATSVVGDAERPAPAYVAHPVGARQTAAAYAYQWADGTNPAFALYSHGRPTVPSDNLLAAGRAIDAGSEVELDCTNYMSQALRVSGFAMVKAWRYDAVRHIATTAWVRAAGPGGLAATFVKLGRMHLMSAVGTKNGEPPPAGIQIGDMVVWDLNDSSRTMHIDHQLMVTEVSGDGRSWKDIRVSYHTYDHRNRAMDEYQTFVAPDAPRAKLYVFHVDYPS